MEVWVRKRPEGRIDIRIDHPVKPSLLMNLDEREVIMMANYIYATAAKSDEWSDAVDIIFVDQVSHKSDTYSACALDWRNIVIQMLRAVDPKMVLASATPAGHA